MAAPPVPNPYVNRQIPKYARDWGANVGRPRFLPESYDTRIQAKDIFLLLESEGDSQSSEESGVYVVGARCNHCKDLKQACTRGRPCDRCKRRKTPCQGSDKSYEPLPPPKCKKGKNRHLGPLSVGVSKWTDKSFTSTYSRKTTSASAVPQATTPIHSIKKRAKDTSDGLANPPEAAETISSPTSISMVSQGLGKTNRSKPRVQTKRTDPKKSSVQRILIKSRNKLSTANKVNRKPARVSVPVASPVPEWQWKIDRPVQAAETIPRENLPEPAARPRIWTSSKEALCELLPALAKNVNGVVWINTETPVMFLEEESPFRVTWEDGRSLHVEMQYRRSLPPEPQVVPSASCAKSSSPPVSVPSFDDEPVLAAGNTVTPYSISFPGAPWSGGCTTALVPPYPMHEHFVSLDDLSLYRISTSPEPEYRMGEPTSTPRPAECPPIGELTRAICSCKDVRCDSHCKLISENAASTDETMQCDDYHIPYSSNSTDDQYSSSTLSSPPSTYTHVGPHDTSLGSGTSTSMILPDASEIPVTSRTSDCDSSYGIAHDDEARQSDELSSAMEQQTRNWNWNVADSASGIHLLASVACNTEDTISAPSQAQSLEASTSPFSSGMCGPTSANTNDQRVSSGLVPLDDEVPPWPLDSSQTHASQGVQVDIQPLPIPKLASTLPAEVQAFRISHESKVPVALVLCRGASFFPYALSSQYGCMYLGFFNIIDMNIETSRIEGTGSSEALSCSIHFKWTPGGETLAFSGELPNSPWWMSPATTGEDQFELMHPFKLLPLHILSASAFDDDEYAAGIMELNRSEGWLCTHCGKANPLRNFRYQKCSGCDNPNKIPPVVLNAVRDRRFTSEVFLSWNRPSRDVRQTFQTTDNGAHIYHYEFKSGVAVQHIFTRNLAALQAEPTTLFIDYQTKIELIGRRVQIGSMASHCYTYYSGSTDENLWTSWENSPQCIIQTRDLIQRVCSAIDDAFTVRYLSVFAWSGKGHRKGCVFEAKASRLAFMCLGANVDLCIFPKSLAAATQSQSLVVSHGVQAVGDTAPPTGIPVDAGTMPSISTGLFARRPTLQKIDLRTSPHSLFVKLIHGDILMLEGDDFEYTMTRTGMSIVLTAVGQA